MTLAIARHHVEDYAKWRKIYEDFALVQKAGGVLQESVYQDQDDANEVVVLHSFADRATADAFLGSAELRETMQRAGVVGRPRIEVFEDAQTLAPSAS